MMSMICFPVIFTGALKIAEQPLTTHSNHDPFHIVAETLLPAEVPGYQQAVQQLIHKRFIGIAAPGDVGRQPQVFLAERRHGDGQRGQLGFLCRKVE